MFSAKTTHLKYTIAETNLFKIFFFFFLQKYLVNICSLFIIILQGQTYSNLHLQKL